LPSAVARTQGSSCDKTGTLTEGKPVVSSFQVFTDAGISKDELLSLTASLEQSSEHPLARAIVRSATEGKLSLSSATGFRATSGAGVEGEVLGKSILAGTAKLLGERQMALPSLQDTKALVPQSSAITPIFVAINGRPAGYFLLSDAIKESAAEAVHALRGEGVRLVMLTGDRKEAAAKVAKELGIEEFEAEVPPQRKNEIIRRLKSEGRIVAMAGDGINDAPALAAADVGIAMGTGTDVAIENAGITLVKGDLRGIVRARKLSRSTVRNIKQNLLFAFLYNAIGIPVAAGVFYPIFGWLLSPMLASAAMSFSSVSVIANALRLRKVSL
jgi:Cu+-exporting ATPase